MDVKKDYRLIGNNRSETPTEDDVKELQRKCPILGSRAVVQIKSKFSNVMKKDKNKLMQFEQRYALKPHFAPPPGHYWPTF